ncbi:Multidrug resistance-associated protein 1 [Coemansia sp. RSA 2320]|nr:Multidrug resistance-associated protein 1 [Coemansia sp. RSA 2320]
MAYVGQSPWLLGGTVRENVLFGKQFDDRWYAKVIHACCLDEDIAQMAHGDSTGIGDQGTQLSGGQKVRLGLARAIYSQADIYLLDNVLSALDANVGKLVWNRVLCGRGLLGSKIRLVSMDNAGYIRHCDTLVSINGGRAAMISKSTSGHITSGMSAAAKSTSTTALIGNPLEPDRSFQQATAAKHKTPTNVDSTSTKVQALCYFGQVCGWATLAIAATMGTVLFAVPAMLHRQQMSILSPESHAVNTSNSSSNTSSGVWWPKHASFALIALDALCDWVAFAVREFVYVGLARSRIQAALLGSLAHAQMSEIWRNSDYHLVSVIRCSERATPLGVHTFLADSVTNIASLGLSVYSSLRLSYDVLVALTAASAGVVYLRTHKDSTLAAIQKHRRRAVLATEKAVHDLFSGSLVIRIHGVYGEFSGRLRELESRQQAVEALANAVLFTTYLLHYAVDTALTLALIGTILATAADGLRPTPADVQYYYETAARSLALLSQLVVIKNNATNHSLVLQELCDVGSMAAEAPWHIATKAKKANARQSRPARGAIEFDSCSLRYNRDSILALSRVSFVIGEGEHVGIVGRTGAGKSSLLQALLRLVELEAGTIAIDGVDVSELGLHDLRRSVSVVPQAAALIEGSVRSNIDPFDEHNDTQVRDAIKACQLEELGADKQIESGGRNLSGGQQQLISICRAVLQRRKILVLDEATANVDKRTAAVIEGVIRREFKHSTVLVIAHRLEATASCDRIIVMDGGRVAELDSPSNLAAKNDGIYAALLRTAAATIDMATDADAVAIKKQARIN